MSPHSSVRAKNQVLAELPAAEWRLIEPHLEWVELPLGAMLYEAGVALRHVYFPTTAIVSLVSSMKDGASAEVAVVGNEGVVGVCAFMGGAHALSGAVVQSAGHALRMTAESIECLAWQSESLMEQLLRYTQALFTHMAQTSACNRHHGLDQKLCRWLLLNFDRRDGNEMIVTQEQIASMLGVRREGVTGQRAEAAQGRTDPVSAWEYLRPGSSRTRGTQLRVLLGHPAGLRSIVGRLRHAMARLGTRAPRSIERGRAIDRDRLNEAHRGALPAPGGGAYPTTSPTTSRL